MPLDLGSLAKSIDSLRRALRSIDHGGSALTVDQQQTLRDGVVHYFEVAYGQCWKFIQLWLRENRTPGEANFPGTRRELFRMAVRHGLVSDPQPWFAFGDARNRTSHLYDASEAAAAYDAARRFLPCAEELLSRLEEKND